MGASGSVMNSNQSQDREDREDQFGIFSRGGSFAAIPEIKKHNEIHHLDSRSESFLTVGSTSTKITKGKSSFAEKSDSSDTERRLDHSSESMDFIPKAQMTRLEACLIPNGQASFCE